MTEITSDLIAVLDDGDGILEAGEAKALSDLTAEDLQKLNITFPVYKLTAPRYDMGPAGNSVDGKPGYDVEKEQMIVTPDAIGWTYRYKIDASDYNFEGYSELPGNNTIDLSELTPGVHKVTFLARNNNVSAVVIPTDAQFYVLKQDLVTYSGSKSIAYTGSEVAFVHPTTKGQKVTYSYRVHSAESETDAFTLGLPKDAGTYDIKASIEKDHINGYLATEKIVEEVTITKADKTEDKGTTTIVKGGDAVTLDFTNEIKKYHASGELVPEEITFTSDKTTVLDNLKATNGVLTLKTKSDAEVNDAITETLTAEINTLKNVNLTLKATVSIQKAGTEVKTVTVDNVTKIYDKNATPETIKAAILEGIKVGGETVSEDKLTIKYNDNTTLPTDAGKYNIDVSFSSGSAIGTGTGKLTINPKELTVKADDVEYTIGGTEPNYSAKLFDGETDVTADKTTYVSGEITATCPSANLSVAKEYDIIPSATAASNNYKLNFVNGKLTVKKVEHAITISTNDASMGTATPSVQKAVEGTVVTITVSPKSGYHLAGWSTPNTEVEKIGSNFTFVMPNSDVNITANFEKDSIIGGGSQTGGNDSPITSGGSDPAPSTPAPTTPSTDKPADTKPADKPVDTTTAKVETNAAGETVITNEAGEAIKNDIVKVDGAKYITDESGVVIKDSFATTPSGNKVFADESGKVITDKTFKVDGVKYVASKSGAIVTDSFATTPSGNKVFCDETGAVVTNTTVVVDGEKYFAKASGAIATKQFVKTPSGNKVYCSKDGSIITNKAFKVGGKQYVATKSGKIVTGKWVTVGSKKYYCNKNGVVTKTKKVSKK